MRRATVPLRTHERIVGELIEQARSLRDANERLMDRVMFLSGSGWPLPQDEPARIMPAPEQNGTLGDYSQLYEE